MNADGYFSHEIKRQLLPGRKVMTNLDSIFKKQKHYFVNKVPSSQSYGFSSSHVWMWELDNRKGWALMSLNCGAREESSLDIKKIKPVNPKGNQPWIFLWRTDAEAPIIWQPYVKSQLIGKDPDAGKDWRQEEKGATEDEMVGWHYRLNEHEFEQAPGDGEVREAWCTAVHGVTKSWTRLSNWTRH